MFSFLFIVVTDRGGNKMLYSLKEQLLYCLLNGWTYKEMWYYVHYAHQLNLVDTPMSTQAISELIQCLYQEQRLRSDRILTFELSETLETQIQQLAKQSFAINDSIYPMLWREIPKPPLLMFYQGELATLKRPCISIVGSRKMSNYGRQVVEQLTAVLAKRGWVAVSGLADGVDCTVHQTAHRTDNERTIAIIPTGLQSCYPKHLRELQNTLAKQQLVLSEYLPQIGVKKHHFIMRNRLVAGLSPVTVVVEAAEKSGSLITANFALQFNREVYAVPGRITDSIAKGCNALIDAGAQPLYDLPRFMEDIQQLYRFQHR